MTVPVPPFPPLPSPEPPSPNPPVPLPPPFPLPPEPDEAKRVRVVKRQGFWGILTYSPFRDNAPESIWYVGASWQYVLKQALIFAGFKPYNETMAHYTRYPSYFVRGWELHDEALKWMERKGMNRRSCHG